MIIEKAVRYLIFTTEKGGVVDTGQKFFQITSINPGENSQDPKKKIIRLNREESLGLAAKLMVYLEETKDQVEVK